MLTRFNLGRLRRLAAVLVLAAIPVSAHAATTILAFGDSLFAGYGVADADNFPAQLEVALKKDGKDVKVVNAAVSGDTTADGVSRLDWSLADKPDLVLLELGANDGLRGLDPERAQANLDQILARLKEKHIPVVLCGMLAPRNLGPAYAAKFDPMYKALADKYQVPLYPFILDGVALDPKFTQADGMHPNKDGVAVIVHRILLFVGIAIPPEIGARLWALTGGLPGAHWMPAETYHLTLRFIGEAGRAEAQELDERLAAIALPGFELALAGVDYFGTASRPRVLWAGVDPSLQLHQLARKIDRAARQAELPRAERAFTPHATIARLHDVSLVGVMAFIQEKSLFRAPPFTVDHFTLFESRQGGGEPAYFPLADYPLLGTG
jgi:acyl-CoA thioesterase-1